MVNREEFYKRNKQGTEIEYSRGHALDYSLREAM